MKKGICICVCLVMTALFFGCGKDEQPKPGQRYIYYVNTKGTALVRHPYEWTGDNAAEEVADILKIMQNPKDTVEYSSAIPEDVEIADYELKDGKLDIYFEGGYMKMKKAHEVLCRAAIVQSLVKISGVDYVSFFIDGYPLTDNGGNSIGYMNAEDFVQNIGPALNSYQKADLNLYFANEAGDRLVTEKVNVRYNSNMSIEKLIVEQLLKGPSSEGTKAVMPPETGLLGISVKDGICYVNFNEGFLTTGYDIDPQIAIYSLVNSIVEGGTASQVQISVDGETNITFQGVIDLSKPLSQDLELVEEIK